jgi:predicted GNAT superfamily acetyltransferase
VSAAPDTLRLRDATPDDFAAILALNAASVHFLSPLDLPRLRQLHDRAAYHRVVVDGERVVAFLLAFREGADYDSTNYLWFAARYPNFLYIDRVVVAEDRRGSQLGLRLYEDVAAFAAACEVDELACEFDVLPPNPISQRFHERFGFVEVGRQSVADGKKQVSLRLLHVPARRPTL